MKEIIDYLSAPGDAHVSNDPIEATAPEDKGPMEVGVRRFRGKGAYKETRKVNHKRKGIDARKRTSKGENQWARPGAAAPG